jgi:hypothetical protein
LNVITFRLTKVVSATFQQDDCAKIAIEKRKVEKRFAVKVSDTTMLKSEKTVEKLKKKTALRLLSNLIKKASNC